MNENSYIASLLKPVDNKTNGRKIWSVDLETVWIPFFTATNAMGGTTIDRTAIGTPLRLAYNQDKSVKYSKTGKPVITIAQPISQAVKMVRENFVAGLQAYSHDVFTQHPTEYKAEERACIEASKDIFTRDTSNLAEAEIRRKAEADRLLKIQAEKLAVAEAIAHAEAEAKTEQPASSDSTTTEQPTNTTEQPASSDSTTTEQPVSSEQAANTHKDKSRKARELQPA